MAFNEFLRIHLIRPTIGMTPAFENILIQNDTFVPSLFCVEEEYWRCGDQNSVKNEREISDWVQVCVQILVRSRQKPYASSITHNAHMAISSLSTKLFLDIPQKFKDFVLI